MAWTYNVRWLKLSGFIGLFAGLHLAFISTAAEPGLKTGDPNHPVIPCLLWLGNQHAEFDLGDPLDLGRLENLGADLDSTEDEGEACEESRLRKRARRGLKEVGRLARKLLDCQDNQQAQQLRMLLLETAASINNLRRPPLPEKIDFFETPWVFLKRSSRPVGKGRVPAANLQAPGYRSEPSKLDPEPSTFWRRPESITSQDLYHGFGRAGLLLESKPLCNYAGPKESFGRNPGFEVESGGMRLKLKFAEVSSEPFASRVFDAVGFHVDPTDFAPQVKIRYSRRIFQEFNLRKPIETHFTFLGILPLFTLQLQQHYDPFDYVTGALLTNGVHWTGAELKRRLLRDPDSAQPEMNPTNFRAEVEESIAYLETAPASVQLKIGKSIGPWDFGDLDHASRRELRGAGLLAAWLGWFDTRFDNTRLRIVQGDGKRELEHYFSDLGGVLGETKGMLYARGEMPNAFPWTFTRPPLWQGPHHLARPLRLDGYKPIAQTPAFAAMTIDDARWMARLIGALSDDQLEQALVASGFSSAQVRLYLAKLLSRRDRMVVDLGLAGEISLSKPFLADRHLSYNPTRDGALRVRVSESFIEAPVGTNRIANGKLLPAAGRANSAPQAGNSAPIGFSF